MREDNSLQEHAQIFDISLTLDSYLHSLGYHFSFTVNAPLSHSPHSRYLTEKEAHFIERWTGIREDIYELFKDMQEERKKKEEKI